MIKIKGTKWLSEAVHIDEIEPRYLNIVEAPVGSGKTTWALDTLSSTVNAKNKMLYLIDTINGREQLLQREDTICVDRQWETHALNDIDLFGEVKIVVMTYAKFGEIVNRTPTFGNTLELIVCDEIHSLPRFSAFISTHPSKAPLHKIAQTRLTKLINTTDVLVIGLSATPARAATHLNCNIRFITVDQDVKQYETTNTTAYCSLDNFLSRLPKQKTGLMYITQVSAMKRYTKELTALGIRCIPVWSIHNTDHPMTEEQHRVQQYIINHAALPPEYDLVIINASSETSINIKSHIDYIVVHSQEEETQIQVRGRYRDDLEHLYLLDYNAVPIVPPEFLSKKLFTEDKAKLCEILNLRNERGNAVKWPTTKKRLGDTGYIVKEGRENNRRYVVITK